MWVKHTSRILTIAGLVLWGALMLTTIYYKTQPVCQYTGVGRNQDTDPACHTAGEVNGEE